jgi:hypothetical protein
MINQRELRIGNWFKYSQPVQIEVFTPYGVNLIYDDEGRMSGTEYTFDEIEPIPLTNAILEKKAGFEKGNDGVYSKDSLEIRYYGMSFAKVDYDSKGIRHFRTYITYVHELQNLYYVLRCEELEINLKETQDA